MELKNKNKWRLRVKKKKKRCRKNSIQAMAFKTALKNNKNVAIHKCLNV